MRLFGIPLKLPPQTRPEVIPDRACLAARFQREDSNRLFQSFPSRNAQKEKGRPTPAFLVVTMASNGLWN